MSEILFFESRQLIIFSINSFVNGIATPRGGTHVSYISDLVSQSIVNAVNKQHKHLKVFAVVPMTTGSYVFSESGQNESCSICFGAFFGL